MAVGDMFAGLFATGMTGMSFRGTYRYASAAELDAAIAAVQELLEAEDEDFASDFDTALRRRGTELRISIETECPSDWYYAYATLVEALAERAVSGNVESTLEDSHHIESYVAAAVSHSLTKLERATADDPVTAAASEVWDASGSGESLSAAVAGSADELAAAATETPPPDAPATPDVPALAATSLASVAQRVAAAATELGLLPSLMSLPQLSSVANLMSVPNLSVPPLVLVPELVSAADLRLVAESVAAVAAEMLAEPAAESLIEAADPTAANVP